MNYSQNQLNQIITNIENLEFYNELSQEDNAFEMVPSDYQRSIYNIEKVIHMWPKPQNNNKIEMVGHEYLYSNDLWVKHQNFLINIFKTKNYSSENINKIDYKVQYCIIRACLFMFYDYLLKTYPFILNTLTDENRSTLLYIIFIILLQSQDVNFIIKNYRDTITSISKKLKNGIELNKKPLPVNELIENLEEDKEYMKKYNENTKQLIKIFSKITWNKGIWESHPEWSEEDNDIISNHWSDKNSPLKISLTVNDFLEKYKIIYNLIYN